MTVGQINSFPCLCKPDSPDVYSKLAPFFFFFLHGITAVIPVKLLLTPFYVSVHAFQSSVGTGAEGIGPLLQTLFEVHEGRLLLS